MRYSRWEGPTVIQVTDDLWIGNNHDVEYESLVDVNSVLNVASDMIIRRPVGNITYAHCGIVDGPGNLLATYHAAILMLHTLVSSRGATLVVDHDGTTRSVVISIMYLHSLRRMGWDHWLGVIQSKCKDDISLHTSHRTAFNRINWRLLSTVIEGV